MDLASAGQKAGRGGDRVDVAGRLAKWMRLSLVVVFLVVAILYVVKTIHWKIMNDSAVMHYVNFLIDHGRKPYAEITDNNMPGAYYTEGVAMKVFGGGDVGWRVYDYFLMALLGASLVVVTRREDWVAGVFAAVLFVSMHGSEGPKYSVEREQVLTVLLMLGYGMMFAAVRRSRPDWMVLFGIAGGLATSIKPTFLPLTLVLLVFAAVVLWRRKIPWLAYVLYALAGMAAVGLLDLSYLLHYGVLRDFTFVLRVVTPSYALMAREGFWTLLRLSVPKGMSVLVLLTAAAGVACGRRRTVWGWEKWALAMGAAFGLFSYMVQGKPFLHHRYTFVVALLVLIGMELMAALKLSGWPRAIAAVAMGFAVLWMVPGQARELVRANRLTPEGQTHLPRTMESDLAAMGGASALQDKVQCFDLVYGCLSSLYHLGIVENTSYTGDLLLFVKDDNAATEYYRTKYWELEQSDPASVIVMTNEWFQQPNSFDRVRIWPAFASFLAQNYTLVVERTFPGEGLEPKVDPDGYRIYVRKTSPLLAKAVLLQAHSGV